MRSLRSLASPKKKSEKDIEEIEKLKKEKSISGGENDDKSTRTERRSRRKETEESETNDAKKRQEETTRKKSIDEEGATGGRFSRLRLRSKSRERRTNNGKDHSDEEKESDEENESRKERRRRRHEKQHQEGESDDNNSDAPAERDHPKSINTKKEPDDSSQEDNNHQVSQLSPMRRAPKKEGMSKRRRDRMVAEKHPELHIIGEITSGFGFEEGGYSCKWSLDYGNAWTHVSGAIIGQTHVGYPTYGEDIVWSHPLDIHFATDSIQGWPRILFQIWHFDEHGRSELAGYAFSHIPCSPGFHHLSVATWRPLGSSKEEIEAFFLGGTVQLTTDELLFNKAWSERCRLQTVSCGKVNVELDIIVRNFNEQELAL